MTFDDLMNLSIFSFKLEAILTSLILLVVCLLAVKVILRFAKKVVEKMPVEKSLHSFLYSTIKILLFFVVVMIVIDNLGISVTSFIAVFSVAGLAISLAIQSSLSNLASGIMILISKPFKVGDYIEAKDVSGTASEIGMTYTKLLTADNKLIFVPNSEISAGKIVNYTTQPLRRIDLLFNASYDCSIELVKASLNEAIAETAELVADPASFVGVMSYKESSIEYAVRVWVKTDDYWAGYFGLNETVKRVFDKNHVEMTYNHINVHMAQK
ncbi:MAG: mechanosensitive ion channel family protein [Oscillospiraceae bacterium]